MFGLGLMEIVLVLLVIALTLSLPVAFLIIIYRMLIKIKNIEAKLNRNEISSKSDKEQA